jgi:hypothetical protein
LVPYDRERQKSEQLSVAGEESNRNKYRDFGLGGGGGKRAADVLAARRRRSYVLNVVDVL